MYRPAGRRHGEAPAGRSGGTGGQVRLTDPCGRGPIRACPQPAAPAARVSPPPSPLCRSRMAYRFALVYRVRAGYPRRHPPACDPRRGRARVGGRRGPRRRTASAAGLVHRGRTGARSGRRAGPRLGVRARPDAPARAGAARGRVPRADHRRPRPRRERPRGPAPVGRRVRRGRPGRGRLAAGAAGGLARGAPGPLDGRGGLARRQPPRIPTSRRSSRSSTPADPARLTRQTFRLANLPIPGLIAWPLAWLTTLVYLRPRGHTIASVSATHRRARHHRARPARPRIGRRRRPGDRSRSPRRRPSRRAARSP